MSKNCKELHKIFNSLPRKKFPFNEKEILENGIYILFEKGEKGHEVDRVVRIGTHTGKNQLRSRLRQHFFNENKDRSIFRKNIGRALLNKNKDIFIEQWEIDLTTKEAKNKFLSKIDFNKKNEIEKKVSEYIRKNFEFVIIPIEDKEKRLETESRLISTISLCKECGPSKNWLGKFSPKDKIKESGLWLVNELYKEPFDEISILRFKTMIK